MKATGSLRVKRGIWQVVIDYQDANGQRRQKSESTGLPEKGNKRKAKALLEKRLQEIEQEYTPALVQKKILFLTFMEDWLNDVMAYEVRRNTLTQYKKVFEGYIKEYKPFHGVTLQDVTPAMVQSYYNAQLQAGLSPNTVRKHHTNIHKCFKYALRMGLIQHNPAAQTELPAKRKYRGATACSPEQLRRLLTTFEGDILETPVRIVATYGLRRSEVCGLCWDAVNFEDGYISICRTALFDNGEVYFSDTTKNDSSNRRLPLTATMRDYLQKVKAQQEENKRLFGKSYQDNGFVCAKPDGTLIEPNFITHHFRRVLLAHDLPAIRFHDLRHSVVYALRQGGCDAKDIQCWLGHSDVSTTLNVYGHLLGGDLQALGAVMDRALGGLAQAG